MLVTNPSVFLNFLKTSQLAGKGATRIGSLTRRVLWPAQSWASALSAKIQIIKRPRSTVLERRVHAPSGQKCLTFWPHKILLCLICWPMRNK